MPKPKLIVLSGAGISAESGIKTFRDGNGLWENHRVEDVATPEAWARNPSLVNAFYNARRAQLLEVQPNAGHRALVDLEAAYDVVIVTQNVDNLHERAGSSNVIHLHGELMKVRSAIDEQDVRDWQQELTLDDRCHRGAPLRPHIVWFGEAVPALEAAAEQLLAADVVIVVGTSMQVYPAAGLVDFAPEEAAIFFIDPHPQPNESLRRRQVEVIAQPAGVGLPALAKRLLQL